MIKNLIYLFLSYFIVLSVSANTGLYSKYYDSYISSIHFRFDRLGTDDGLSQSSAVCMHKDKLGFMWFGTYNGLNMYDGYNFKTYSTIESDSSSISNNMIWSIAEDADSNLWVGTYGGGVNMLNIKTEKFTRFTHNPIDSASIAGNIIKSIAIRDSLYWFATENGLSRYIPKTNVFRNFTLYPSEDNTIIALHFGKDGFLWIGTTLGLIKFDPITETIVKNYRNNPEKQDCIGKGAVICITEDTTGNMYIGTWGGGLNIFDKKNNKFTTFAFDEENPKSISNNVITCLELDKSNKLWIGTRGGGIDIFDPVSKRFHNIRNNYIDPESLSNNTIYSIMEDEYGIIWIGTDYGGINKYDQTRSKFRCYRYNNITDAKLFSYLPTYLYEDSKQRIWIAGEGGCTIYDRENNTSSFFPFYYKGARFESGTIRSVKEDYDGTFWISSDGGGLMHYFPKTRRTVYYTHNENDTTSIGQDCIYSILIDKEKNIWLGTQHAGVYRYNRDKNNFSAFPVKIEGKEINVNSKVLFEDSFGNIIIGSADHGLVLYNPKTETFQIFSHDKNNDESISDNYINVVFEDQDSTLWIGTMNNGLNKFNRESGTFQKYKTSQNLSNNRIFGILQDDKKHLWISTDKGLNRFDIESETFQQFYKSDGILNHEFQINSYVKLVTGELAFGTKGGIVIFLPYDIVKQYKIPQIYFTDVKLFNSSIEINTPATDDRILLSKPPRLTETLMLNYEDRVVSFDFSLLDYTAPNSNIYAYKLDGFDDKWNYIDNQHSITFTNLPPGDYILHIKAANSDLIWNKEGVQLNIVVIPPFWQTWWFRLFSTLTIMIFIYVIYLIRVRNLQKQREELEKTVKQRTKEIDSMNKELLSKTDALAKSNILLKKRQIFIEAQSEALHKQKEELQQANKSLKKSNETKNKLFSIISHDIRSPFSSIMGFSDLLNSRIETLNKEKIKSFASNINQSSKKVFHLLDNLLLWAKTQQDGILFNPQPIIIKDVIEYTVQLFEENAKSKKIRLFNETRNSKSTIVADKDMFITIVRNLLNNAIKFTSNGGVISVLFEDKGDDIIIKVQDSGEGIPDDLKDKLLSSEKIVSTLGTNKEKGTGLGLILCKEFTEMHNGEIWFESELGEGTTFFVKMPKQVKMKPALVEE